MKIAGGLKENGIVVGNTFDKYASKNPIVRWMMKGFDESLGQLVDTAAPESIYEVGCGEGYWVLQWNRMGHTATGSDFSSTVIELARKNAIAAGLPENIFEQRSIYELDAARDSAQLVVCCEIMEHLEHPDDALGVLQQLAKPYVIFSVPKEPIWRVLNMARGKYLGQLGNTPGHIQHWSSKKFIGYISQYFDVLEVKKPFPWTMLLCRVKELPDL